MAIDGPNLIELCYCIGNDEQFGIIIVLSLCVCVSMSVSARGCASMLHVCWRVCVSVSVLRMCVHAACVSVSICLCFCFVCVCVELFPVWKSGRVKVITLNTTGVNC